jgi:hypothetical protein
VANGPIPGDHIPANLGLKLREALLPTSEIALAWQRGIEMNNMTSSMSSLEATMSPEVN